MDKLPEGAAMNESQKQFPPESPDWTPLKDALDHPKIKPLVKSYSCFHWLLRKHRRRLVEGGALLKAGKNWTVSISRAPAVIEEIYREQTLAALDRAA
jgi:hypothetical protein